MGRRPPRNEKPPDPIAVLEGRARATVREVLALIHDVNPTGLELATNETSRRYALKSRLQSFLIQRFSDELTVDEVREEERVINIRHGSSRTAACHAVVADLDEDARLWARRQIAALQIEGPRASSVGAADLDDSPPVVRPGSVLARAQRALADYDYDEAERLLLDEITTHERDAARMLLEMWVDQLALYDRALALQLRLSPPVRELPSIRLLLALAAARSGKMAEARTLLHNLDDARAAEAFVLLAQAALDAGTFDDAREHMDLARGIDPQQPELRSLELRLKAVRDDARKREERALEEALSSGSDRCTELARALAARFPESELAHRVLFQEGERRMLAEVRALSDEADRALSEHAYERAAELLVRAARLAPPDEEVVLSARAGEARQRARSAALDVNRALLIELLATSLRHALDRFAVLDGETRRSLRELHRAFAWADTMITAGLSSSDAVAAANAMMEAAAALDEERPAHAHKLLSSHASALRFVDATADLRRRTRQLLDEQARQHTARRLDELSVAVGKRDLPALRALTAELEGSVPAGAQALLDAATRILRTEAIIGKARDREAKGNLIGARQLLTSVPQTDADVAAWSERLRASIRAQWSVHAVDGPDARLDFCPDDATAMSGVQPWLDESGETLVFVSARERWLFIQVSDAASGTVRRMFTLRAPGGSFAESIEWSTESGFVRIAGNRHILDVSLETGEPTHVVDHDALHRGKAEGILLVPGSPFAWLQLGHRQREESILIIDVTQGSVVRTLDSAAVAARLSGSDPPVITSQRGEERVSRYTPRGTALGSRSLGLGPEPLALCQHPRSDRLLAYTVVPSEGDFDATGKAQVIELSPDGEELAHTDLNREEFVYAVWFSNRRTGELYAGVGAQGRSGPWTFQAFDSSSSPPRLSYELHAPKTPGLVENARSGCFRILARDGNHVRCLQPEPGLVLPDTPEGKSVETFIAHGRMPLCGYLSGPVAATARALLAAWSDVPEKGRDAWLERLPEKTDVVKLAYALRERSDGATARSLTERAFAADSSDASTRLLLATLDVDDGRWDRVYELLGNTSPLGLDEARARHFHHLSALALQRLDRPDDALAIATTGMVHPGSCPLDDIAALSAPEDAEDSFLRDHAIAIRAAATHLRNNAPREALPHVDVPRTWHNSELQSAGWLSRAWLMIDPSSEAERARKAFALAHLLDVRAEDGIHLDIPVPHCVLHTADLDELVSRAQAWLDGYAAG